MKKVSRKPFDTLVEEKLLAPLGLDGPVWDAHRGRFRNGDLMPHAGFRLRPRDLAKIGQMVLDRGKWQNRQVVSADWIAQSTAPQINGEGAYFYGYQWWLGRSLVAGRQVDWVAGMGLGGQRLYIVPKEQLVVVVNAGLYDKPLLQAAIGSNIVLNRYVFPAVKE